MKIGIPKETREGETRVAASPEILKKLVKRGIEVVLERGAGMAAGFNDEDYIAEGIMISDRQGAFASDIVLKVWRPDPSDIPLFKSGSALLCSLEPHTSGDMISSLAKAGVNAFVMEWIPRTSRAQSMDVLSSQANIAGYRAVLEGASQYGRFLPLMMTSAGSAKAAKVTILGVGVAGLQAIATAKRLGALVQAYDVRSETKEQVQSLGAKFIEVDIGEEGAGTGGYAKELSEEAKKKLQAGLNEVLKKSDIIITTANVPGRKAPTLISEEVVRGMRRGSVIVDMAAPSGGNCVLTELGKTVEKYGVKIIGLTNFPALVPTDSSSFYGKNLANLLALMIIDQEGKPTFQIDLKDDILDAALVTYQGAVRKTAPVR